MPNKEEQKKAITALEKDIRSCKDMIEIKNNQDCEYYHKKIANLEMILNLIKKQQAEEDKLLQYLLELKKLLTEELKYNCTKREANLQLEIVDSCLDIMRGGKGCQNMT